MEKYYEIRTIEEAVNYSNNRQENSDPAIINNIDFSGITFSSTVDFRKCKFYGEINFSHVTFEQEAIFDGAQFMNFAVFDHAHFNESSSFKQCSFIHGARFLFTSFQDVSFFASIFQVWLIFWNSMFLKDADFSQCIVELPPHLPESSDRQANFSWAIFEGDARFTLSKFFTPLYLWRTIFKENVFFDNCLFDKEVVIGAKPTDVHFTKSKQIKPITLNALMKLKFLQPDMENQYGDNYQFINIYSEEQLSSELNLIGSVSNIEKNIILEEWAKGNYNMFQDDKNVSFSGAKFNSLKTSVFNYVNLSNTYCDKTIHGTEEEKEYFVSVLNKNSHDYFISYAHELKDFSRTLAKQLTKSGQIVWFDEEDIIKGDKLYDSLKKGIENSRYFIMVLSEHYFAKEWTLKEKDLVGDNLDKIIQIWYNVSGDQVREFFPELADRVAFDAIGYQNEFGRLAMDIIREVMKKQG